MPLTSLVIIGVGEKLLLNLRYYFYEVASQTSLLENTFNLFEDKTFYIWDLFFFPQVLKYIYALVFLLGYQNENFLLKGHHLSG